MTTLTDELKPCPFCGGEAHISDDYSSERGLVYSIWHDCPAGGDYHPYGHGVGVLQVSSAWFSSCEDAIEAWNTRAERTTTRKGKHKTKYGRKVPLCERCGYAIGDSRYNYCPSCGAKIV